MTSGRSRLLAATTAVVLSAAVLAAAGTAKGTATYKSKKGPVTVTFTHAALVAGPDVVSGKLMRRLVLSTKDVSAAIKACESMMSCSDGGIEEGMTVDFSGEPRLGFWFVANGQLIQHSGVIKPEVADPQHRPPGSPGGNPDVRPVRQWRTVRRGHLRRLAGQDTQEVAVRLTA